MVRSGKGAGTARPPERSALSASSGSERPTPGARSARGRRASCGVEPAGLRRAPALPAYDLRHGSRPGCGEGADLATCKNSWAQGHSDHRRYARSSGQARQLVNALEATMLRSAGLAPRREADHHGPEGAHPALPPGLEKYETLAALTQASGQRRSRSRCPGRGQALTLASLLVVSRNWQSRPQ